MMAPIEFTVYAKVMLAATMQHVQTAVSAGVWGEMSFEINHNRGCDNIVKIIEAFFLRGKKQVFDFFLKKSLL